MRPTTRSLNPPTSSPQQPVDRLAHYILIKMTLSGDYFAKDKLGDTFLLCSSRRKIKQQTLPQIAAKYLLQSVQVIQEEGNCYQVFQLTQKLFWAGDHTNMGNKSQLQCLSLLYSAIKNIVKPLVQHGSAVMTNYISLENLWFRDTRCYLLMCKRSKNKNIFKTQHVVRTLLVSGAQNKEAVMVSKLGEVFWDAFYPGEEGVESSNNNFRLILKAMIKGQLSLSDLLSVMEEKAAKKKFIAHHRSKQLPQTVDISSAMSTIEHESIYQRIENMPMSVGRRTLFFKSNIKSRHEGSRSRQSRKGRTSVDLSQNISPPSFSKGKRSKRYSLFSGAKHQRHTIGDDSFTRDLKISIPAEFEKRYTRTIEVSQHKEQASYFQNNNRSTFNKERRQLRSLFDEMKSNKLMDKVSRYERLESTSEKKALNKFKSIFETSRGSESKIDDNDFKQAIKQKSFYRRQNINQVIKQASRAIQKGEEQISLHLHMKSVQLSTCMEDKQAGLEKYQKKRSGEVKVYNENIVDNKKQGSFHRLELPKENDYFSHPIEEQRSGNVSGMFSKEILRSIPTQQFKGSGSKFNRQKLDDDFSVEFLKPIEKNQQRDVVLEDLPKDQRREENRQKSKTERSEWVRKQEEDKLQKARKEEEIKKKQREERQRQNQMRKDIQEAVRKELEAERKKEEEDKVKAQKKDYYSDRRDIVDEDIPAAAPSTFVSKKRQNAKNQQKQLAKANKINDKQQKISRNIFSRPDDYEDQIEEIQLTSQPKINQKNILKQHIKPSPTQSHSQNMLQQQKQIKAPQNPPNSPKQPQYSRKNSAEEVKQQQQSRKGSQRVKTGQSAGSQQGPKGVRKQIDQYMYMVNKMGEAVAKSGKLSKKLEHVDWYVGVYFLYKRFYYERKKIQKYLIEQLPKLSRRGTINLQDWKEWLVKGQRDTLLNKCQDDNRNIEASLKKMAKKMDNMSLAASIALNIPITKNLSESSMLAIEHIMNEYDQLVQLKLLDDPDIYIHINEMINALWVMSELDGKIEEKKSVLQYGNVKRTPSELNSLVKTILNFYYEQQQ